MSKRLWQALWGRGLVCALGCLALATACGAVEDPRFGEKLMAGIDDLPSVGVLKTHYPDDYERLRAEIRSLRQTGSLEDVERAVSGVFLEVSARQYAKADAESVYGMYRVIRNYAAALQEIDPKGCVGLLEGQPAPPSLARVVTREMQDADMAATARLLAQTAQRPAAPAEPMSMRDFALFAYPALATLPEADQEVALEVLRAGRDPASAAEDQIMCAYNLAVADRYLALPAAEGGELIRAYNAMAAATR